MQLSIYLDGQDFADVAKPVSSAIAEWIKSTGSVAELVDEKDESDEDTNWKLGIKIRIRKKGELRDPLKKLYEIANKQRQEFAISIIDEKSGESEEICYFGYEEGKPDAFEVANYLGLV